MMQQRKSIDTPKAKVKPRTVWEKPDYSDVTASSCLLSWKSSSIPDYAAQVTDVFNTSVFSE